MMKEADLNSGKEGETVNSVDSHPAVERRGRLVHHAGTMFLASAHGGEHVVASGGRQGPSLACI